MNGLTKINRLFIIGTTTHVRNHEARPFGNSLSRAAPAKLWGPFAHGLNGLILNRNLGSCFLLTHRTPILIIWLVSVFRTSPHSCQARRINTCGFYFWWLAQLGLEVYAQLLGLFKISRFELKSEVFIQLKLLRLPNNVFYIFFC